MKTNIGAFDGWFRTFLFVMALSASIIYGGPVWWLMLPATIFFMTALLRWCPLYDVLGVNTSKTY
ncbi:MAG: DUF2892 domain-containing protein [Chitinophagales bacterium]|nr:DUF2892 domain-containing protein [Chitinophagales bacterium]MDW8418996.1 DUF2892 domain-containing protein [Chitinophagales bacterium]